MIIIGNLIHTNIVLWLIPYPVMVAL